MRSPQTWQQDLHPQQPTHTIADGLIGINEALLAWQGAFNIYATMLPVANQQMYVQYKAHNITPIYYSLV